MSYSAPTTPSAETPAPTNLRTWRTSYHVSVGINGIYDFANYPQRGIGAESIIITRWTKSPTIS